MMHRHHAHNVAWRYSPPESAPAVKYIVPHRYASTVVSPELLVHLVTDHEFSADLAVGLAVGVGEDVGGTRKEVARVGGSGAYCSEEREEHEEKEVEKLHGCCGCQEGSGS
jgi:hypothetical protein